MILGLHAYRVALPDEGARDLARRVCLTLGVGLVGVGGSVTGDNDAGKRSGLRLLLGLVGDDFFQFRNEQRKVFSNGIPKNLVIYKVIAMDKPIAHADDFRPRNIGISSPDLLWHLTCCLTDQLNQVELGPKRVCDLGPGP